MRKFIFIFLLPAFVLGSCKKDASCPVVSVTAPASEVAAVKAYLDAGGITALEDSRGFFFNITNAVSENKPTTCNGVFVNYSGSLTNGVVFDSGNGVSFPLSNLILGWQEGLPLIGAGGSITLYLPPSLGYGANATGSIPANSILIFNITLLGIY